MKEHYHGYEDQPCRRLDCQDSLDEDWYPRESELKRLHTINADLLAALERARQHLSMNEWIDDEGARRRFAAVEEVEAAIAKGNR